MRNVLLVCLVPSLLLLAGCAGANAKVPKKTMTSSSSSATTSTAATTTTSLPPSGQFRVHSVNVGQGDGTIWEFPDGTVLVYDCGPSSSNPTTNPVTLYLRDVLAKPFGSTIWGLVASHGHLDHIAGCEEVFSSYVIQHVYDIWYQGNDRPNSYQSFKDQAVADGATLHVLLDDPSLTTEIVFQQWDTLPLPAAAGVTVTILWPGRWLGSDWDDIARNSIVLRATHGTVDYCFEGDIETAEENTLAGYAQDLNCEVYLVGHHGSKYASASNWLAEMDPEYAVVSFGTNSYGHPTREALCRVQMAGAQVWATHRVGTVTVASEGSTVSVSPNQPETKDYCASGASYW